MPRIIAGQFGGRVIDSPPKQNLRPMMSKVRAALFDMLWHFDALHGRMLDLYAGSGAVGIKALSRGTESVDFVEVNPVSVHTIRRNLAKLKVTARGTVHRQRVEDVLARPFILGDGGAYDLISVTPPYAEVDYHALAELLIATPLIKPKSIVFFEHPRSVEMADEIGPLVRLRHRYYGRTSLSIYDFPFEEEE